MHGLTFKEIVAVHVWYRFPLASSSKPPGSIRETQGLRFTSKVGPLSVRCPSIQSVTSSLCCVCVCSLVLWQCAVVGEVRLSIYCDSYTVSIERSFAVSVVCSNLAAPMQKLPSETGGTKAIARKGKLRELSRFSLCVARWVSPCERWHHVQLYPLCNVGSQQEPRWVLLQDDIQQNPGDLTTS